MSFSGLKHVKLYCDGADLGQMKEAYKHPWVKGFTTNPSLMKKAGVTDYVGYCHQVLKELPERPISFEIFADDLENMKRQAEIITTWGEWVYVKVPVTNSLGVSTAPLIRELTQKGIKLNVTALFTIEQVREVCEALKGGAANFVSVFAGRLADAGQDPIPMMKESLKLCRAAGPQCELLWASTREPFNIIQADEMGCDIITVPPDMIAKTKSFGKDPKAGSLETVQTFKKDSEFAGFKL